LISTSDKCLICSRMLTLHEQYSGQICSDWRCRARQLDDALLAARAEAARDLGLQQVEAFPISVVPWRANRIVELPAERRSELEEFLVNLLSTLPETSDESIVQSESGFCAEPPPASAPNDPEVDLHLAKVCAVCQGFCCFYGATRHAFLDSETMCRFGSQHPDVQTEAVVAEYLRYLPENHCEASCVYHTEVGCALPRQMRADICNSYECHGLKDARQASATSALATACVVVRHDNHIVSCAFIDASGIRNGRTVG